MTCNSDEPIRRYLTMISGGNELSGYWFDAYGWIACYFAQLEGLSYALIDQLGAAAEKLLPFAKRTKRAKELVCSHLVARGDAGLAAEWEALLTEAIAAAPMRNKILHNPLSINLALGDPLHDEEAGIVLVHEAGQPILKLGTVQAFAEAMMESNLRMNDLLERSRLSI